MRRALIGDHHDDDQRHFIVAVFKPTANGWVYRSPTPFIFGRATHVVVNDAQRAHIIGCTEAQATVGNDTYVSALLLVWVGIVTSAMWALGHHSTSRPPLSC